EQRLRIERRTGWGRSNYGIYQRPAGRTVAIADQSLSSYENGISRSARSVRAHLSRCANCQSTGKNHPSKHLTTLLLSHAAALFSLVAQRLNTTVASSCSSEDTLLSLSAMSASSRVLT